MSDPTHFTDTDSVVVVPAAADDLDAIVRIEQRCFTDDAFSRRELEYLIGRANGSFFVARCEDGIAGYVSLLRRRGCALLRIYSIAVDPVLRGRGIGALLLDRSIACAHEQGMRYLSLEVRTDNAAAQRLYESRGFRRTTFLRDYYAPGADAWRMRRDME